MSDPLTPMTPGQITNQATNSVRMAYSPAFKELDAEGQRARGLADKRTADNKFYSSWVAQQGQMIQAHNDAANRVIDGFEHGVLQQNQQTYQDGMQHLPGGELGQDAAAHYIAGNQNTQAAAGHADDILKGANDETGAALANSSAVVAGYQSKNMGNLDDTLSKINIARDALAGKQSDALVREIQRLQGVNISIAQSNRNFDLASTKLGVTEADIKSKMADRVRTGDIAAGKLKLDWSKADQAQADSDRKYQLDVQKYNSGVAKDLYQREHGLGPYKPGKTGTKPALSQASQNAIFNKIGEVQGRINYLVNSEHMTPVAAWHVMHNGGWVTTPGSPASGGKAGKQYIHPVGDDGLLNAAYNARDGGLGLSEGDIKYLHNLGVTIGSRLPLQTNTAANSRF